MQKIKMDPTVMLNCQIHFYFRICMDWRIHLDFKLNRMRKIPAKRQIIRTKDIFSVRPCKAIPVVTIKIKGPTNASNELI